MPTPEYQSYAPGTKTAPKTQGAKFNQFVADHETAILVTVIVLLGLKNRKLKGLNRHLRWENQELVKRVTSIGDVSNNPALFDALFGARS